MGSIADVKHVVILMLENRSFDEYFGTFPGAAGFGDPADLFQNQYGDGLLPFRMSTFTAAGLNAYEAAHGWYSFHIYYNGGQNGENLWAYSLPNADNVTNQPGVLAYNVENDIPFHWWMARNFALCDHYFCSVLGPTDPNRIFLMSGEIGLDTAACLANPGNPGYNAPTWPSYPDLLTQANVSWKVYDDWQLYADPSTDAYGPAAALNNQGGGLNVLNLFPTWNQVENSENYVVTPGSTMFPAQTPFEADAIAGNLPVVSWITPPNFANEWEGNPPSNGAAYIATKLQAILQGSWDDTVFILTYDEFGGHFDHLRLPPPPTDVPQENVSGSLPGGLQPGPVGPGMRVPAIIISPWTVGRGVQSQNFDHGSILQFLEQVTKNFTPGGVQCPNLNAWRRSTFGDLTSVFDFDNPVSAAEVLAMVPWNQSITEFTQAVVPVAARRLKPFAGQAIAPPATQAWPVAQSCEIIMPDGSFDLAQAKAVAVTAPDGSVSATFKGALQVTVTGFEPDELYNPIALSPPRHLVRTPTGTCTTRVPDIDFSSPNITVDMTTVLIDQDPAQASLDGVPYSSASLTGIPCTFTFTYDLVFRNLDTVFPPPPASATDSGVTYPYTVNASFQIDAIFKASAELELVSTADPQFFRNFYDDTSWLSGELVVFSLAAGETMFTRTLGDPAHPTAAGADQALAFINAVIEALNAGTASSSDFDALNGAEEANQLPLAFTPAGAVPVFNFALARVRSNSTQPAHNVRVFFRTCRASVTTGAYDADTQGPTNGPSYKPAFYRSNPASGPAPGASGDSKVPLLGVNYVTPAGGGAAQLEYTTIPFFANPRVNAIHPNKAMTEQSADGPANVRDIGAATSSGPAVAYFGCWLDINQNHALIPAEPPSQSSQWDGPFAPGTTLPIQSAFLRDLHQCIVAEISYDPIIIPQGDVPGSSAWLAQRNLGLIAP